MISIDFIVTDGTHTLHDALYLQDNHGLSDAEIEVLKQERFDNWVNIIKNPPELIVDAIDTVLDGNGTFIPIEV